jgi:hypothetical protein
MATTPTTPTVLEINCETGEQIERQMTAEEISAREALAAESARVQAEQEVAAEALATLKASARAKLVAGTPLTTEEAATLVI